MCRAGVERGRRFIFLFDQSIVSGSMGTRRTAEQKSTAPGTPSLRRTTEDDGDVEVPSLSCARYVQRRGDNLVVDTQRAC